MNIHEYQGKSILKSFGVAIQEGIVAETPEQAVNFSPARTRHLCTAHSNDSGFLLRDHDDDPEREPPGECTGPEQPTRSAAIPC